MLTACMLGNRFSVVTVAPSAALFGAEVQSFVQMALSR